MSIIVDVRIDTAQVQAIMAILQARLSSPGLHGWLHGVMVPFLQNRAINRFANEGDEVTGKWTPLKASTVMIRQAHGHPGDHPINVRTGQMRNFIVAAPGSTKGSAGYAALTWPGPVPTGKMMTKVQTAQVGNPGANTVARPILGVGPNDSIFAIAALTQYLLA